MTPAEVDEMPVGMVDVFAKYANEEIRREKRGRR